MSTPTQCSNVTVEWTGGQAPFILLLVPTEHLSSETRMTIPKDISTGNFVSFVLDFPAQSHDATGIGAGGTSVVTTVASSDSSCLSTTESKTKFFLIVPEDVGQCDSIDISWGSEAEDPVDILGLGPGGQSFQIANVTDSSTSFDWTADVRSETQIMFVAGDNGLGSGGSSDVMQISDGVGDGCIKDSSPSSTTGVAAGGVSSTTQGQAGTQTAGGGSEQTSVGTNGEGSTGVVTTDNAGSTMTIGGTVTTDSSGSIYTIVGSTVIVTSSGSTMTIGGTSLPITTTDNAGSTVTIGGTSPVFTTDSAGSTITIGGGDSTGENSPGSTNSDFPGSGGGTVTGSSDDSSSGGKYSTLGIILGLIFGLLALGLIIGGILLYRRRRRDSAYRNLETNTNNVAQPHSWVSALTRGVHIRSGANSSVDTLPSMYQTEPFILPSGHLPYYGPHPPEPPSTQRERPNPAAHASSNRGIHSLLGDEPYTRDVFGGALAGIHGPDRKDSVGPHGRLPSRTGSGRAVTQCSVPPPVTTDLPIRVIRDSEDFSPEVEMSPNPIDDAVVEIPPTYASVRRASRSSGRESWHPARAQLVRSNASRHSRRSTRSDAGVGSHETST